MSEPLLPDFPVDDATRCGEHFARHTTWSELVAICTLPCGHGGDHDNVLPKAGRVVPPGQDRADEREQP